MRARGEGKVYKEPARASQEGGVFSAESLIGGGCKASVAERSSALQRGAPVSLYDCGMWISLLVRVSSKVYLCVTGSGKSCQ